MWPTFGKTSTFLRGKYYVIRFLRSDSCLSKRISVMESDALNIVRETLPIVEEDAGGGYLKW